MFEIIHKYKATKNVKERYIKKKKKAAGDLTLLSNARLSVLPVGCQVKKDEQGVVRV